MGIPARVTDTMLPANEFLEDSEQPQIFTIAPGEGNVPLSIFRDILMSWLIPVSQSKNDQEMKKG